jgi:hypothetical protein|tara:strand:+ start:276 stop:494 length:219 start_codon:yes stop_codon:yes gene_type:complete
MAFYIGVVNLIGVATIEVAIGLTRVGMLYGVDVPWFVGGLIYYNVNATRLLGFINLLVNWGLWRDHAQVQLR